jgi:hypothetical protein
MVAQGSERLRAHHALQTGTNHLQVQEDLNTQPDLNQHRLDPVLREPESADRCESCALRLQQI